MNKDWGFDAARRARTSASTSRLLRYSLVLLACSMLCPSAFAARHALLIGVSDYKHIRDMDGPVNDVMSLRELLNSYWGFEQNNISILLDAQATKIRIEAELAQLVERSQPGDHIFIYYSGHGTSRLDARSNWPLPYTTGALIPFDFDPKGNAEQQLSQLVVGRWALKPLLQALDNGGRSVFVAIDACFSGNTVRSQSNSDQLARRYFPLVSGVGDAPSLTRGDALQYALDTFRTSARIAPPYPYDNVFFLSASGEHEFASDISAAMLSRFPTVDGKPHGAFTDAILRALAGQLPADTNRDNQLSYSELHRAVRGFMDSRGYPQTPRALPVLDRDIFVVSDRAVFDWATLPVVAKPGHTDTRLRVRVPKDLTPVRDNLAQISGVQLTDQQPDLSVIEGQGDVILLASGGNPVVRTPLANKDAFARAVRQQIVAKSLIATSSAAQRFAVKLDLSGSRQAGVTIEGEEVSFSVVSERDAYLMLLTIDPIGNIHVIYPSLERHLSLVRAGEVFQIPEKGGPGSAVIQPPFGREHIVVLAFTQRPGVMSELLGAQIDVLSPKLALLEQLIGDEKTNLAHAVLQLETVGYPDTARFSR